MGKIHHTAGAPIQIQIEDFSVPVVEEKSWQVMFKCVDDLSLASGVGRSEIIVACDTGKQPVTNYKFRWPSIKEVATAFPGYRIVKHPQGTSMAKPTTVHLKTPGAHEKAHDLHYRSMEASKITWGLTKVMFETIIAKGPGWKDFLPPIVVGLTVHEQGWAPKDGWSSKLTAAYSPSSRLFELKQGKSNVSVKYVGPGTFGDVIAIPGIILANGLWK